MPVYGNPRLFHKKFAYVIDINGLEWAGFKSCSEIKGEVATIEHWEGGVNRSTKSPGRVTFPPITLERGATSDLDLYTWFKQVVDEAAMVDEPAEKRELHIIQKTRNGTELRHWMIFGAWVKSYSPGSWDNGTDENTMESVVLEYDYFELGQ